MRSHIMQHFYQKMAVIAVSATLAAPAFAASYATASTQSFYWVLNDLAPDDGIDPSITWNENFDSVVGAGIFQGGAQVGYFETYGAGTFGDVSDSLTAPSTVASANVTSGTLYASGSTTAPDTEYHVTSWPGTHPGSFTLSPQTEVQFFLLGSVYADSAAHTNMYNYYAYAYAGLGVFESIDPYDNWIGIQGSEIEAYSQGGINYVSLYDLSNDSMIAAYPPMTPYSSLWLDVAYSNPSNNFKDAYIFQYAGVDGASITVPVPEPENYAMLLAGLGVIGLLAKRRNANTA